MDAKLDAMDKQLQAPQGPHGEYPPAYNPATHYIIASPQGHGLIANPQGNDLADKAHHRVHFGSGYIVNFPGGGLPGGGFYRQEAPDLYNLVREAYKAGYFSGPLAEFADAIENAYANNGDTLHAIFLRLKRHGFDCFGLKKDKDGQPESVLQIMRRAFKKLAQAKPGSVMAPPGIPDGLTVTQFAEKAGCTTGTISRACDDGAIHHSGKGRDRRIDPEHASTKTWMQAHQARSEVKAAMGGRVTTRKSTGPSKPKVTSGFCRHCTPQVTVRLMDGKGECPKCGSTDIDPLAPAHLLRSNAPRLPQKPAKIGKR